MVLGPQVDRFTPEGIAAFLGGAYEMLPQSDRMGARLRGPRIAHARGHDIISDGIALGSIQVPGDGQPIVLLVDRQSTGGYTKMATVCSFDIGRIGQVKPGQRVRFRRDRRWPRRTACVAHGSSCRGRRRPGRRVTERRSSMSLDKEADRVRGEDAAARAPCTRRRVAVMPGGNSRTTTFFDPYPFYFQRGQGAHIWDADGIERVDFNGNYTSLVLGHAPPDVVKAVQAGGRVGLSFPGPTEHEVRLAEMIDPPRALGRERCASPTRAPRPP